MGGEALGCWDLEGGLVGGLGAEVELADGEERAREEFLHGLGLVVDLLEMELEVLVVAKILGRIDSISLCLITNLLLCSPASTPSIRLEAFSNQRFL